MKLFNFKKKNNTKPLNDPNRDQSDNPVIKKATDNLRKRKATTGNLNLLSVANNDLRKIAEKELGKLKSEDVKDKPIKQENKKVIKFTDETVHNLSHLSLDAQADILNMMQNNELSKVSEKIREEKKKATGELDPNVLDRNENIPKTKEKSESTIKPENALVKSEMTMVEKAKRKMVRKEFRKAKGPSIFDIEETGIFLGIILGFSSREQIIGIMKAHSKSEYNPETKDLFYYFEELDFTVTFDENDTALEFSFGKNFKGKTILGLEMGESIETAIEIYGKPKMKSAKGAMWNIMKTFCDDDGKVNVMKFKR